MKRTQTAEVASILFALASLLSKILGFVRDLFLSNYFGVSKSVDALSCVLPINAIFQNLMTSAVVVSFIPLYLEELSKDESKARKELSVVFNVVMLVFFVLSLILIIFSTPLVKVFAPGFEEESLKLLTKKLIDLVSISGFLWAVVGFLFGLAQLKKHFFITAILPLFANIFTIIGLVLFHSTLGIYSYVFGLIVGLVLQSLIMIFYAVKYLDLKITFNFSISDNSILKKLLLLSIPLLLLQLTNYFVNVFANRIASNLSTGSIASIQYANKLRQLWVSLLIVPIATAYYPFLSEKASKKDFLGLSKIFTQSLEFTLLLGLPITLVSFVFANPIVKIVFERGAFDSNATLLTTLAFKYFSVGIFALMITTLSMRVLYSMKEMYLTLFVSVVVAIVNIALFYPMVKIFSHAGIPLAISIGLIIEAIIFLVTLEIKTHINLKDFFVSFLKIGVSSLVSVLIMYVIFKLIGSFSTSKITLMLNFAFSGIAFLLIYIPSLFLLKVESVNKLISFVKKFI